MTPIIEAHGLTKRFGDVRALDGLELVAEPGQVTALLGPNGAGKTTFVRAVATLLRLDSGTLRVFGRDVRREPERVRPLIGLAGQYAGVEPAMTGRENLEMVARRRGHRRPADHAVPRRSRPARGPDHDHRPRADDRRGDARRAQAPGRRPRDRGTRPATRPTCPGRGGTRATRPRTCPDRRGH